MALIGDLVARLRMDSTNFQANATKARGTLGSMVGAAKAAGAALAAVWASSKIIQGAKAAVDAATTQIQAEKKLEAVLKATGGAAGLTAGAIRKYAAELQNVTNFGDDVTINAAAMLATFKEIGGDVFKETIAAAQDMSVVMDSDLKGSIVQLGKALNDPIRGMTALTRAGVTFTDQQREQVRALQESGDLIGAQRLILAEVQGEFGGAAKAAADPMKQLGNAIGDLSENLGFLLLPSVKEIAMALTGLSGDLGETRGSTEEVGEALGNFTREVLAPLISDMSVLVRWLIKAGEVTAKWKTTFDGLGRIIGSNLPVFKEIALVTAILANPAKAAGLIAKFGNPKGVGGDGGKEIGKAAAAAGKGAAAAAAAAAAGNPFAGGNPFGPAFLVPRGPAGPLQGGGFSPLDPDTRRAFGMGDERGATSNLAGAFQRGSSAATSVVNRAIAGSSKLQSKIEKNTAETAAAVKMIAGKADDLPLDVVNI